MKPLTPVARPLLSFALACAAAAVSAAPTDMELRVLGIDTRVLNSLGQPVDTQGRDVFRNGDPLTGMSYERRVNGGAPTTAAGTYATPSPFTAGAERTNAPPPPSDFAARNLGLGGLSFRRGDATLSTSNLTPPTYDAYSLSLVPEVDTATGNGAVFAAGGFEVFSVWNFAQLRPGEVMGLGTNGSGGEPSTGRLFLRYFSDLSGQLRFAFETEVRDINGTRTRTTLGGEVLVSDLLADLSGVDYIGFTLTRAFPAAGNANPQVRAEVSLLDASLDAQGDLVRLASTNFGGAGTAFSGNVSGRSTPFAFASWLDPEPRVGGGQVPEPASLSLALAALAGLGLLRRRAARC